MKLIISALLFAASVLNAQPYSTAITTQVVSSCQTFPDTQITVVIDCKPGIFVTAFPQDQASPAVLIQISYTQPNGRLGVQTQVAANAIGGAQVEFTFGFQDPAGIIIHSIVAYPLINDPTRDPPQISIY